MSGNVEVIEHLINKVNFSTKNAFIQVPTKIELTFLKKKSHLFYLSLLTYYFTYFILSFSGGEGGHWILILFSSFSLGYAQ